MSSTTVARETDLARIPAPRPIRFRGLGPVSAVLGLVGALISFAASWVPSFWGDEAASVMSAERPLSTLWGELGRVDAVHGAYYVFLHFWIQAFGASELSVRLPSAIAIGVAVAGTVVLADLLLSRRVAILAGVIFAVLPRVTYMGAEGRSYAMSAAIGVWLTVLLVVLLRRSDAGGSAGAGAGRVRTLAPWIGYGVLLAASIYVFLYLALLAGVHLLVMLSTGRNRALIRRWLLAAGIAVVLAGPVLAYGLTQHHQIAFLGHRNYATFTAVFVTQWFDKLWLAIPAWALIVVGTVVLARKHRSGVVLLIGWLVLPTTALIVGNFTVAPMYNLRYLSFCTPVVAIMMAVGVTAFARNWMRIVVVAAIVGLAVPSYVQARTPFAKDLASNYAGHPGSDLRQASAAVAANATAGDAVVFDQTVRPSRQPRMAIHLYPADYVGLRDVTLATPYYELSGLWDAVNPITATEFAGIDTVWALELPHRAAPADIVKLEALGYTVTKTIPIHRTTVYELNRDNS
jgi:mannosyltransferase